MIRKLFFLLLTGFSAAYGQQKDLCLIRYNEFDEKGREHIITSTAWLNEMPDIPDYTYFDKDLGKKVVIKTKIVAYKGESVAEIGKFKIKPGDYAKILLECPQGKEIQLINIEKLLPEDSGKSLAFETKTDDNQIIFICYPFESDFPFKFEEDIVSKTFTLAQLEKYCSD